MALEVWREYQGVFELVGSFTDGKPHHRLFSYDGDYLKSGRAHAISLSLPLREEPYEEREYGAFFGGMVPEGGTRIELSQRFQIVASDYLSLLERLGDECIGALRFVSFPAEKEPSYRRLTTDDVASLDRSGIDFIASSMQESRLSLAGAQSKTGLYLRRDGDAAKAEVADWFFPEGSAPSTHILKVASQDMASLPSNEFICMETARACGLEVACPSCSSTLPRTFISERFDRFWPKSPRSISGMPVPLRLHQENFCQALGWKDYLKYEVDPYSRYARICGNLIREVSSNAIADIRSFMRQMAFDYLIGNCDSHMKNHSFIYAPSWDAKRLAPAYDIVCTTVLGYDRNLGIVIGEHRAIDDVEPADFDLLVGDVRAVKRLFKLDCHAMIAKAYGALQDFSEHDGVLGETARMILKDAMPRFAVLSAYCDEGYEGTAGKDDAR